MSSLKKDEIMERIIGLLLLSVIVAGCTDDPTYIVVYPDAAMADQGEIFDAGVDMPLDQGPLDEGVTPDQGPDPDAGSDAGTIPGPGASCATAVCGSPNLYCDFSTEICLEYEVGDACGSGPLRLETTQGTIYCDITSSLWSTDPVCNNSIYCQQAFGEEGPYCVDSSCMTLEYACAYYEAQEAYSYYCDPNAMCYGIATCPITPSTVYDFRYTQINFFTQETVSNLQVTLTSISDTQETELPISISGPRAEYAPTTPPLTDRGTISFLAGAQFLRVDWVDQDTPSTNGSFTCDLLGQSSGWDAWQTSNTLYTRLSSGTLTQTVMCYSADAQTVVTVEMTYDIVP